LYSNIFEKLGKSEMKIKTSILIFQTPKKHSKGINVQSKVDFTKDGTSNVIVQITQKNYHYGFFFLLMELETNPITFYHHTLKYHNTSDEKIKQEKFYKKF